MRAHDLDLIVIGGSAGALEPLMQLLAAMPPEITAPIACVIHLLPRQPSLIPALLARTSLRSVREPEDKEPLLPRSIYVAPPNYHLLVERSRSIALSVDDPVQFSRPSIDVLFASAVDAFGGRTAGIILSGSNSDGAAGLGRIARAGGIAIVQTPDISPFDAMPRAALAAAPGAVTLSPAEIGTYLMRTCRPELQERAP